MGKFAFRHLSEFRLRVSSFSSIGNPESNDLGAQGIFHPFLFSVVQVLVEMLDPPIGMVPFWAGEHKNTICSNLASDD